MNNIVILTGAGISTESGLKTFRDTDVPQQVIKYIIDLNVPYVSGLNTKKLNNLPQLEFH